MLLIAETRTILKVPLRIPQRNAVTSADNQRSSFATKQAPTIANDTSLSNKFAREIGA